jgi:hypothetical protein
MSVAITQQHREIGKVLNKGSNRKAMLESIVRRGNRLGT